MSGIVCGVLYVIFFVVLPCVLVVICEDGFSYGFAPLLVGIFRIVGFIRMCWCNCARRGFAFAREFPLLSCFLVSDTGESGFVFVLFARFAAVCVFRRAVLSAFFRCCGRIVVRIFVVLTLCTEISSFSLLKVRAYCRFDGIPVLVL